MNTAFIVIAAVAAPLLLAVAVGVPAWLGARGGERYAALRRDYRVAIGLPAERPDPSPGKADWSTKWIWYYYGYGGIMRLLQNISPALSYTAQLLLFAGLGLWCLQLAFRRYTELQAHPEVARPLRKVPLIQAGMLTALGLGFFWIVHFIVLDVANHGFKG